jgi:hypothetical protein
MYEIQFRKHMLEDNGHPLISGLRTLKDAKAARCMSGDLVIDSNTKKVVVSDGWLFDWEKADRKSCAHLAVSAQLRVNLIHAYTPEAEKNNPGPAAVGHVCWVYSHGMFAEEAVLARIFNYTHEVDYQSPEPYLAIIAGSICKFMYARPREYGHPISEAEVERALTISQYGRASASEMERIYRSPVRELIQEVYS